MSAILSLPGRALSWGYHQVESRAWNLGYAGANAYQGVLNAATAVISTAGDLATLRNLHPAHQVARIFSVNTDRSITNTYLYLLQTLNPNAQFYRLNDDLVNRGTEQDPRWHKRHPLAEGRVEIGNTPTLLRSLAIKQQAIMNDLNQKDSHWINRNISARLFAPVSAIAMVVATAVTTVFGAIAAVLSFIPTFGMSTRVNTFAFDNLRTPGFMLNQLHQGVLGFFRPHLV